ncbi:glycoprotein hormone beta-5-like [Watersipora subatra]|uniref:glycoprotein hormone beta-5-like n=1 Tax=Watersipora subatra TaxID=2589382 RepID=UPI00355AF710
MTMIKMMRMTQRKVERTTIIWKALWIVLLLSMQLCNTDSSTFPRPQAGCNLRNYRMNASTEHCWSNITVPACWGFCQSSEVGTANPPFTIARHKVCGFRTYQNVTFTLLNCHRGYAAEKVVVPSALSCSCTECDTTTTHCEG